jgi:ribosomal protein S18 acetylase RimI-like enzyme
MSLESFQATEKDIPVLAAILTEANQYKLDREDRAWGTEPFSEEEVKHYMANSTTYVVYLGAEPVGTFALRWDDERIWGEQPSDAGYLHRLAIKQVAHGQNLGEQIIAMAEQEVSKNNRQYLRLDCAEENKKLCAYYEKRGFIKVGRKEVISQGIKYIAALYEKRIEL